MRITNKAWHFVRLVWISYLIVNPVQIIELPISNNQKICCKMSETFDLNRIKTGKWKSNGLFFLFFFFIATLCVPRYYTWNPTWNICLKLYANNVIYCVSYIRDGIFYSKYFYFQTVHCVWNNKYRDNLCPGILAVSSSHYYYYYYCTIE